MQGKSFFTSTEVLSGAGMIIMGICALASGRHDLLSQALAPFGVGLVLSDGITRAAHSARERIRVRIEKDEQ